MRWKPAAAALSAAMLSASASNGEWNAVNRELAWRDSVMRERMAPLCREAAATWAMARGMEDMAERAVENGEEKPFVAETHHSDAVHLLCRIFRYWEKHGRLELEDD